MKELTLRAGAIVSRIKKYRIGEFGRVLVRYASSQLFANFLRMASGFLVVRFVTPVEFGMFSGIGVYMGYILMGHGGILNGLARELPYEIGRGNQEEAARLANSVNALTFLLSLIAALIFLGFGIYYLVSDQFLTGMIFLSYALPSFLYLYNKQFLPTLYRTNKDFDNLSRQNIMTGVGNVVSVLFVYLWGLWGLCIRSIVLFIYETWLLHKRKPYKLSFRYQAEHFRRLFKTGFPIYLAGNINPLVTTVMNNLLFAIGGALNFGYYALTNIVNSAIGIIPNSFSQVIYPRMAMMYGEGKTLNFIVKKNIKPLFFQFGVLLGLGIVGAVLLPWAIPYILPKYMPGVEAAQWMMFFPAVQAFGSVLNIYGVIKNMRPYIIANVIGGICTIGYVLLYNHFIGFDLVAFPQGFMIGRAITQALGYIFLLGILKKERNGIKEQQ